MRHEFTVATVTEDSYTLVSTSNPELPPISVPTNYFGQRLAEPGTKAYLALFLPTDPEAFRRGGRFYGYPECCIEDCVTRVGPPSPAQREAGEGTGFIPCPSCTRQVLEGKPLHELLLPTRRAPKPFTYPRRLRGAGRRP